MRINRFTLPAATLALAVTLTACGGPGEDDITTTDDTTSQAPVETPETSEVAPTETTPEETETSEPAPTESSEPAATETSEPAADVTTLAVTVEGAVLSPNAEEISLAVGEPLRVTFDSDRGGELHVHSTPDQYVQFEPGTSEQEITFETPGSVEIEEHETGAVLAVVEVR